MIVDAPFWPLPVRSLDYAAFAFATAEIGKEKWSSYPSLTAFVVAVCHAWTY
jgi:hypothetical protein